MSTKRKEKPPAKEWISVRELMPPRWHWILVTNSVHWRGQAGHLQSVWLFRLRENPWFDIDHGWIFPNSELGGTVVGVTHWRFALPEEAPDEWDGAAP